jgi:MFS family permease
MVVLSLGQIAEVVTMLVLGRVLAVMGWRRTMILGVLGHMIRFLVFAFAPDNIPVIIASQLLHGVCYAFFFATLYIFVDEVFPKDVRASAQGLFNLLILGIGMVIASFVFPALVQALSHPGGGDMVVDYRLLFMVPTALAAIAVLLLGFAFKPPTTGPGEEEHLVPDVALNAEVVTR